MSNGTHTQGPWYFESNRSSQLRGGDAGRTLVASFDVIPKSEDCPLIAAAPEMLGALREAERFMEYFAGDAYGPFDFSGTPQTCLALIRATIAKASPAPIQQGEAQRLK